MYVINYASSYAFTYAGQAVAFTAHGNHFHPPPVRHPPIHSVKGVYNAITHVYLL